MSSRFIRTTEDFECEHCGVLTRGDGFTNHCPECLWSKHVDNYPGDRANECGGLMEPVGLETKDSVERLIHRCTKCGEEKRNKVNESDNRDAILKVA